MSYLRQFLLLFTLLFYWSNSIAQQARSLNRKWEVIASYGKNYSIAKNELISVNDSLTSVMSFGLSFSQRLKGNLFFSTGIELETTKWSFQANSQGDSMLVYFRGHPGGSSVWNRSKFETVNEISESNYQFASGVAPFSESLLQFSVPLNLRYYSKYHNFKRFYLGAGIRMNFKLYNWTRVSKSSVTGLNNGTPFYVSTYKNPTMRLFHLTGGASLGMEWNFIGTSTLRLGLDYSLNLTSVHKKNLNYAYLQIRDLSDPQFPVGDVGNATINDFNFHQLKLVVAIGM
ncbi:MAG: hypothetical protein ACJASQ_002705 [Crocinitomicaceae bacterium]